MLFVIRCTLILIWCHLFLVRHLVIVSGEKKHRFFHHHHHHHHMQQPSESDGRLNSFSLQRNKNYQTQYYNNDNPCTRTPCTASNECIRLQHRHNHTKIRYRCVCIERPCRHKIKNWKTKNEIRFC